MFDIGFWELTIIAIVALVVIGPERLPGVARTVGLWFGKARGFITSVKADIDKELQADELKKMLDRHAQSSGLHDIIEETESALKEAEKQDYLVRAIDHDMQHELDLMSSAVPEEDPVTSAAQQSPGREFDHHKSSPSGNAVEFESASETATQDAGNKPDSEPTNTAEQDHVAKP